MHAKTWEFLAKETFVVGSSAEIVKLAKALQMASGDELIGTLSFVLLNMNPGADKRQHLQCAKLLPKAGR